MRSRKKQTRVQRRSEASSSDHEQYLPDGYSSLRGDIKNGPNGHRSATRGAHRPGPDGDRLDRSNKEYVTKPGSSNRNSEGKGPDLSDRFLARLHLLENLLRAGGIDPPTAGGQLGDDLAKIAFPFLLVRFGGDEIQKFAQQKNQT